MKIFYTRFFSLAFLVVFALSAAAPIALAGDGDEIVDSNEYQVDAGNLEQAANELQRIGLQYEADNIREGRPTGRIVLNNNTLLYIFMVMKMMLTIHVPSFANQ